MTTTIWWARRDLRLAYNDALQAALGSGDRVIPVFILDPKLLAAPEAGEKRVAFLFAGLRALDSDLRERGSRLVSSSSGSPRRTTSLLPRSRHLCGGRPLALCSRSGCAGGGGTAPRAHRGPDDPPSWGDPEERR